MAFVRDGDALRKAMAVTAEYLPTETKQRNPSDFTPELSRRARGVDIWAAMRSLGRSGISEMVERHCRQARLFARGLTQQGFEILAGQDRHAHQRHRLEYERRRRGEMSRRDRAARLYSFFPGGRPQFPRVMAGRARSASSFS